MEAKELVQAYYNALIDPDQISKYVHPDLLIQWDSTRGYVEIDSTEIVVFAKQSKKAYNTLRLEISHIIQEGNTVSVRYTNHITTHEEPFTEKAIFHSMAIWEVKDGLLYRGYVMSHLD
jgi:predicted GNAT superfamily acetyltransferase